MFLIAGLNKRHGKHSVLEQGQEATHRLPHLATTTLFLRPSYPNEAHTLFSIVGSKHRRLWKKNTFPNEHYLPHDMAWTDHRKYDPPHYTDKQSSTSVSGWRVQRDPQNKEVSWGHPHNLCFPTINHSARPRHSKGSHKALEGKRWKQLNIRFPVLRKLLSDLCWSRLTAMPRAEEQNSFTVRPLSLQNFQQLTATTWQLCEICAASTQMEGSIWIHQMR